MSADDYFTKNQYKGKIYKTNNMLGKTLSQIVGDRRGNGDMDSADEDALFKSKLTAEQKRIEAEIEAFEKNLFGDQARKDSLDSIRVANEATDKKAKKSKKAKSTSSSSSVRKSKTKSTKSTSSNSSARVSVRRERH